MPGSPERPHVRHDHGRHGLRFGHDLHDLPIDPDVESDAADNVAAGRSAGPRWPHVRPGVLAAVFIGGLFGGLARSGVERVVANPPGRFPWDSFAVNLAGAFGLALLGVLALELAPALRQLRPVIATGFFGAFTTFSALAVGVDQLVGHGEYGLAVAYGVGSVVGGLAAASLGFVIGRAIVANRSDAADAARLFEELTGSGRR